MIGKRRGSYFEPLPGEPTFAVHEAAEDRAREILKTSPDIIQRGLEALEVRPARP
jgi:beta-phosphoglucomutase-like phosphatase (HAD superfamily)